MPPCDRAGHDSEVFLVPRRIYKDPFRGGENIIVLADTYEPPRVQADGSLSELKVRSFGECAGRLAAFIVAEACGRIGGRFHGGAATFCFLTRA